MIYVVLAAGLGLANFIAIALLFRRLRGDLNRQLSDMRAERNSEWILHALKGVQEQGEQAAQAANGYPYGPPPSDPQPVRRKRHLGLYLGGGLVAAAAALAEATRQAWDSNRGQLVAVAGATAIAVATAVMLIVTQWPTRNGAAPPPSAPTATATVTRTPSPTPPSTNPSTTPGPTVSPGPSASGPSGLTPGPAGSASGAPIGNRTPAPPSTASSGGSADPGPPGGGTASPTALPTPPPDPSPPQLTPSPPPGRPALCLGLALTVLDLAVCLSGGG